MAGDSKALGSSPPPTKQDKAKQKNEIPNYKITYLSIVNIVTLDGLVLGLGNDGNMYYWDRVKGTWEIYKDPA